MARVGPDAEHLHRAARAAALDDVALALQTTRLLAFAEVELVLSEVAAAPLVLQLAGSGHRVEVPMGFCAETLRRLLEVVA